MSLATNLAIADVLYAAHTGLFRVMAEPDARAEQRLRHTARALGIEWPAETDLRDFERSLNGQEPKPAALLMAIRRAGGGASYVPFSAEQRPWHAAMAATYSHATAPLRRLADRYVVMATLAIANGRPVPDDITAAFTKLPEVMRRADDTANQIERAVIDLAEVALLSTQTQRTLPAVVTDVDDRGARIQLCKLPIVVARRRAQRAAGRRHPRAIGVGRHSQSGGETRTCRLIRRASPRRSGHRWSPRTARRRDLR